MQRFGGILALNQTLKNSSEMKYKTCVFRTFNSHQNRAE